MAKLKTFEQYVSEKETGSVDQESAGNEVEEGNAFGDAVAKAKKAGETEFEFEGETFKVEEAEATISEAVTKVNASGYIKAGVLGYNDQFIGKRSLSYTLSSELGLDSKNEYGGGDWIGFDHVSMYASGKNQGTVLSDALTGKYTYEELKAKAADHFGIKESAEVIEDSELEDTEKKSKDDTVAVSEMLEKCYESCKEEAMLWKDDAHDSHTVESYMAENAALIATLAVSALKEMNTEYSTEAFEAACNKMVESYTTKITELKETELSADASDIE